MNEQVRDGWFVRAAARVGDLGSPFYEEEHQRDVWNEASAVGFQLLVWLLPVAAVVSVWVGGAAAVPYALVVLLVPGVASWVVLAYAQARGVNPLTAQGVRALRWRAVVMVGLLVAFCAGVLRVQGSSGFTGGAAWGAVLGGVLGVVGVALAQRRARRQRA
ncbi:DUF2029 domain-containing protein [Quadrisphaera sp. KR29]|uniref:DUF2029 domain-containing protein n=1 Tax=Quadrisphaera sp. KR29 TaxID=3461391 RepID=UPI00404432B1